MRDAAQPSCFLISLAAYLIHPEASIITHAVISLLFTSCRRLGDCNIQQE